MPSRAGGSIEWFEALNLSIGVLTGQGILHWSAYSLRQGVLEVPLHLAMYRNETVWEAT